MSFQTPQRLDGVHVRTPHRHGRRRSRHTRTDPLALASERLDRQAASCDLS